MNSTSHRVLCLYFANCDVRQIAGMVKGETKYSVMHRLNTDGTEYVLKFLDSKTKEMIRCKLDSQITPTTIAKELNLRPPLIHFIMKRLGWKAIRTVVFLKLLTRCGECQAQYRKTVNSDEPCPYCEARNVEGAKGQSDNRTNVRPGQNREHLHTGLSKGSIQARAS